MEDYVSRQEKLYELLGTETLRNAYRKLFITAIGAAALASYSGSMPQPYLSQPQSGVSEVPVANIG